MKSLVEMMLRASEQAPETLGYTFLVDGRDREASLSFRSLSRRAMAVGKLLRETVGEGSHVLLLYPPGLDFLTAFFGCMAGGCVAVPVYPPDPTRLDRTLPRLQLIADDSGADTVLTTARVKEMFSFVLDQAPSLAEMNWVCSDEASEDEGWGCPPVDGEAIAFIQYTSGSTSAPRGVMVSHRNLLHNLGLMHRCFDNQPGQSHAVNWLPLYHDMGLIGAILQPMFALHPATFMSPLAFLSNPVLWLEAISKHRGTHCGGPDFGYQLCTRRVKDEELERLDLSCWRLAFDGAEPVRPETLRAFSQRFAPCGFRPEAFYPCYGLAEATLFVSGGPIETAPRILTLDSDELEQHKVRVCGPGAGGREVVGAGLVHPEAQVRIVAPGSCPPEDLSPETVGEVLVKGGSVARGYWGTQEAGPFRADGWLHTGDLAFVHAGELFVMGRLKDLIIIRGRNHYPQDLERTAERAHPSLRTGCAAAFSLDLGEEEVGVIVLEARPGTDTEEAIDAIRSAVAAEHDLLLHAVALVEARSIPKTSSGKIQRAACRQSYTDGSLQLIGARTFEASTPAVSLTRAALFALDPRDRPEVLRGALRKTIAAMVGVHSGEIEAQTPLVEMGLDSLRASELQHHLRTTLEVEIPLGVLLGGGSVQALTELIMEEGAEADRSAALRAVERSGPLPLSFQQTRAWGFDRLLEAGSFRFHVSGAYKIQGHIDPSALASALRALAMRHESLRTRFIEVDGVPFQTFDAEPGFDLATHDLRSLDEAAQRQRVDALARGQASALFCLTRDPLVRVALVWTHEEEATLLVTLHHIIADAASVAIFMEDLAALYDSHCRGVQVSLPPQELQFADFAVWQRGRLSGPRLEAMLDHWRHTLRGHPAALQLKIDAAAPEAFTEAPSAHLVLSLGAEQTSALRTLSRTHGATLYMTLFAVYQALLAETSGAQDMLVDSVFSNRTRPALARMVGFVAENLVVRADLSEDPTFSELLSRVRSSVLDVYDNLAWRSLFATDPALEQIGLSPICFNMQPPTFEARISHPSASFSPMPALTRRLMVHCLGAILYVFEEGQGLHFDLVHNLALFDVPWAERFMGRLEALLLSVADDPNLRLSELR